MFGKKPTVTGECVHLLMERLILFFPVIEQVKTHNRELKQTDRELVRDRHKIDAEEQRLVRGNIFHRYILISFSILRWRRLRKQLRQATKKYIRIIILFMF